MSSRMGRDGDRPKRKSHARPDRIIEKRQNWQDYLDPEEDPGLPDDEEDALIEENLADRAAEEEGTREE